MYWSQYLGVSITSLNWILGFLSNKDSKVSLQDFEIVKCIGKGGFAKVFKGIFSSSYEFWLNSEKKGNRINICYESNWKDKNREN